MKHEKKLLRWMKELLTKQGLNAKNWRYTKVEPAAKGKQRRLVIIHKHSLHTREIEIGIK